MLVFCVPSFAQDGAHTMYSPYSIFGVGDIYSQGNTRDMTMGGVGIAGRDARYINMTNPAAISARDTLSVLFDMGLRNDNKIFRQGDFKSANNTLNLNNFAISFRLRKNIGLMVGIAPYSSVGYDYKYEVSDPDLLSTAGFVSYTASGTGGLYQVFGGVGTTFFKRLSVGAQVIAYMGNIEKKSYMSFTNSSFRSISSGYDLQLSGTAGKFGLQYEQPIGSAYLTVGATYKTGATLKGTVRDYKFATLSNVTDTVSYHVDTLSLKKNVKLASEIGVGISIRKVEKWSAEINYTLSNWNESGFDSATGFANLGSSAFSTTSSQSIRAGFEIIPNRNDLRYYLRQCAYRGGIYYEQAYYKLDGNTVNSYGLTLGMTFPVVRYYNGLTLGIDIGRRGSMKESMTQENYAKILIGFNIHDLWFIKHRYQ